MKRELLKIAKDLDKEIIDEQKARSLLFSLLSVGVPKGTLCKCGILYKVYNEREGTIVCTCCGKSKLA